MSLNKLLCKHFDDGEKGYVTLGDIGSAVITASAFIIFGAVATFIIGGAYLRGAWLIHNGPLGGGEFYSPIELSRVLLFIVASVLIVVLIAAYIVSKLASIRVATCGRKEGD